MKVLHLPTDVGGNAIGLSHAENKIGLESSCLIKNTSWLNYPADINLELNRHSKIRKIYELSKTFASIRKSYDIFHFNFGSSLLDFNYPGLRLLDLNLYPKNKKILMTYNGCDARQKYPTLNMREISACNFSECYQGMCNSGKLDSIRAMKIDRVSSIANHIFYLNPDLAKFLPPEKSSLLPYTISGWNEISKSESQSDKPILRVVHAPTNRVTKGSNFLISAVERINAKKKRIELILVENISHKKALEIYRSADLFIDQLLVGWYGAVSVEVMKMGIPVGCYLNTSDLNSVPREMKSEIEQSFINMNPFMIEDTLNMILGQREILREKSLHSVSFVNKWHDPIKVAHMVKRIYEQ